MANNKIWAVGDEMHLGSDDDNRKFRRDYGLEKLEYRFEQIHDKSQGRILQFGSGQNHDVKVIKSDAQRVHMLCSCGATWDFPQPSSQNHKEDKLEKHPNAFHSVSYPLYKK